jgi:hypothetical protein
MKRFVIICLIALFAYLQVGYFMHSLVLRASARKEMKQVLLNALPDSSLHTFSLQDIQKQMEWEEKGHEFWYAGKLYDVVKTSVVNGKHYLHCVNDTKEKAIVEQQLKLTKNANGKSASGKMNKFQFPDIFLPGTNETDAGQCFQTTTFASLCLRVSTRYTETASPPPQV